MSSKCLYLIPNAHLDPVWLWPWRDGYSEAHNTIQSAVDRLKENPDMTFSCSSSSIYEWIEEANPTLFNEMKLLIEEGRFEIVGGWTVQSDTIIASGESLIQQAIYGKKYFKKKFNKEVEIGYSVDSFGQNCGLPKILAHSGFKYYVMHRPDGREKQLPNVFWWNGNDGSQILTLRTVPHGYNTNNDLSKTQFFELVERAILSGCTHQTFFMGVGDHGGGPTKEQIEWVCELQTKYNMKYSTLENYFKIVEKQKDLPEIEGELTHHAPGCYSAHSGIKRWISRCGLELSKAETLLTLNNDRATENDRQIMDSAWRNYLFNHFHDIYPGSSIESAYEDARDSLGGATDQAKKIKIRELHRMAKQINTSSLKEGGIFVFNPLPWQRKGIIEVDTFMDPNSTGKDFHSLKAVDGTSYPIQWNRAAVNYGPCLSKWGKLTALVDLPAMGYQTFSLEKDIVDETSVEPHNAIKWFKRIAFEVIYDIKDVWAHKSTGRLGETVGIAKLVKTETLEKGPVRSRYRAFYQYADSSIILDLIHYAGLNFTQADLRVDWREINHTLKMAVNTGVENGLVASEQAYDIIERQPDDYEQPMHHWLAAVGNLETVAVISDSTFAYDSFGTDKLRLTILRAVPYAVHTDFSHGDEGVIDIGEQTRRFWLTGKPGVTYRDWLPRISQEARFGVEYVMESNHSGDNPRNSGDRVVLKPESLTMGACITNEEFPSFRVYNNSNSAVKSQLIISASGIDIVKKIAPNSIFTYKRH